MPCPTAVGRYRRKTHATVERRIIFYVFFGFSRKEGAILRRLPKNSDLGKTRSTTRIVENPMAYRRCTTKIIPTTVVATVVVFFFQVSDDFEVIKQLRHSEKKTIQPKKKVLYVPLIAARVEQRCKKKKTTVFFLTILGY